MQYLQYKYNLVNLLSIIIMYKKTALFSLVGGLISCLIAKFNDILHQLKYTRKDYTKKFINGYIISFITILLYEKIFNSKNNIFPNSQLGGFLKKKNQNIETNNNTNIINTNNSSSESSSNYDYFKPSINKSKLNFNNGTPSF